MSVLADFDIDEMTLADRSTVVSVPVPEQLLALLDSHPDALGLPQNESRRKLLALLLVKGAMAARGELRAVERERYFASLAADPERQAVAASVNEELAEDGIL